MKTKTFILSLFVIGAFILSGCQNKESENKEQNNTSGSSSQLGPTPLSSDNNTDKSVKGVYLNYETLDLAIGKSVTLKAMFDPSDAIHQTVTWESSNSEVASVSSGLVTALSVGETDIKVTTEEGGFTASCHVTTYIKTETLKDFGTTALMTGSGSAVYAAFLQKDKRNKAYKKLKQVFGIRVLKAETVLKTLY